MSKTFGSPGLVRAMKCAVSPHSERVPQKRRYAGVESALRALECRVDVYEVAPPVRGSRFCGNFEARRLMMRASRR